MSFFTPHSIASEPILPGIPPPASTPLPAPRPEVASYEARLRKAVAPSVDKFARELHALPELERISAAETRLAALATERNDLEAQLHAARSALAEARRDGSFRVGTADLTGVIGGELLPSDPARPSALVLEERVRETKEKVSRATQAIETQRAALNALRSAANEAARRIVAPHIQRAGKRLLAAMDELDEAGAGMNGLRSALEAAGLVGDFVPFPPARFTDMDASANGPRGALAEDLERFKS